MKQFRKNFEHASLSLSAIVRKHGTLHAITGLSQFVKIQVLTARLLHILVHTCERLCDLLVLSKWCCVILGEFTQIRHVCCSVLNIIQRQVNNNKLSKQYRSATLTWIIISFLLVSCFKSINRDTNLFWFNVSW